MKKFLLLFYFFVFGQILFAQTKILNKPLPDNILNATLYSNTGDSLKLKDLLEKYNEKYIYIHLWATWCKTCIQEIPYLNSLETKFDSSKIIFIYIATDESNDAWIKFLNRENKQDNHFRIEKTIKPELQNFLKIKGIPYSFILDSKKIILQTNLKYASNPKAEAELKKIIER